MPFPGLTRLSPQQLLTDVIWNELMDLLEGKFSGSVGGGDIQWPFILQGDIDFGGIYNILNLRTFWNIKNAAEYASLDDAISAAEADGGGLVLIPPDTTLTANNLSIDASKVVVMGCGPSSVIQITAASTNPLFTTASTGLSDIIFANLTLDGSGGGAGCKAILARRITRLQLRDVYFTGFTGDFITLTNDGVAGNSCVDARLINTYCSGGSDSHLFADDIAGLYLDNFISKNATGNAIEIIPTSSSNLAQDISINNTHIATGGAKGIRILGTGAPAIDAHSRISLHNCRAVSMTDVPFEIGGTGTILKTVKITGCQAVGAVGDALRVGASGGEVCNNLLTGAGGDGIDLTSSTDLWVNGNSCQSAVGSGINATSTTGCTLITNNVSGSGTGITRTSSATLRARENFGDVAPTVGSARADTASYTKVAGSGTGDMGFSYVIPANTVRPGDMIRVTMFAEQGGGGAGAIQLRINGLSFGTFVTATVTDNQTETLVVVKQGSASPYVLTQMANGGNAVSNNGSQTIDWTVNQTMTVFASTGPTVSDIVLQFVLVEYIGAV